MFDKTPGMRPRVIAETVTNQVCADDDYRLIARRDSLGRTATSLDRFNGLMKPVQFLKSPANATRLTNQFRSSSRAGFRGRDTVGTDHYQRSPQQLASTLIGLMCQ